VRHRPSEDWRVHSRDLESILVPPRVECVDRVLQVMVLRVVLARQHLPQDKSHKGKASMLADHLLPVEDLFGVGELHVPWPGNTLDLVLQGLGDTQLEQETVKLRGKGQ
jgi:hypothetical protein